MKSPVPTLSNLQPNPLWSELPLFDRTGWKRMAFGEFAESIGERAEPKDAQEEIYVGLEHLDPQCLHLRRWGRGSDVTGTKLRITVRLDLSVRVDAPEGCSREEIEAAVRSKGRWLAKHLDEIAAFHPLPKPYRFVSGETLHYLERQYRLRVVEGESGAAKLRSRYLDVPVEERSNTAAVRDALLAWYRGMAEEIFAKSFARCIEVAERHGAERPSLSIRRMKTRWGSCTRDGRMTLNLYLVQAPVHCIVMHELCHTVEQTTRRPFTVCSPGACRTGRSGRRC